MSIEYILRTYALDTSEREKLTLMGPYVLEKGLQIEKKLSLESFSSDVLDLLEEQGAYGNLDSLNYLGVQYLMGTPNIERDFQKAREMFEKALSVDPEDSYANMQLGIMYMMGILSENGEGQA
jgi:TPR repeat protein